MPYFTIVIPSYNRGHIVVRAIESVLNQSYSDFEIIVVDDGNLSKMNII
jgi:glycosyltransferase involved in cell wall biosynthesis